MKSAKAYVNIGGMANVETVHVEPGQVVTVWLNGNQVELRVLADGTEEIFIHTGSVEVKDFEQWEISNA